MAKEFIYSSNPDNEEGVVQFNSRVQALESVGQYREDWTWLLDRELSNQSWTKVQLKMSSLFTQAQLALRAPEGQENDRQIEATLDNLFEKELGVPLTGSRSENFFHRIRKTHGDQTAAACLAVRWGIAPPIDSDKYVSVAITAYGLFKLGMGDDFINGNRAALRNIYNTFRKSAKSALEASEEYQRILARDIERSRRYRKAVVRRFKTMQDIQAETLSTTRVNAESEHRELLNAFREQLKLKAPVQYWSDKARQHRDTADKYKRIAIVGGPLSALLLLAILSVLATITLKVETKDTSAAALLLFATMGVVATTAILWAARIVVRLFLSEHHLSIDAEERATMASTYLALTAEGAIEPTERQLVLASLFRPTADGIVKDDAVPALGPGGILSNALTK